MAKDSAVLRDLMESQFFQLNLAIRDERTKKNYRFALANLESAIGRTATLADLTDDNVVRMVQTLLDRGLSRQTANDRRKRLAAFWRWLTARKICDGLCTVPALRVEQRIPRAWTKAQLQALLDSCRLAPGRICGARATDWWLAFHRLAWDSGERTSALLAARWADLDLETGTLLIPGEKRKGGVRDAMYQLQPDTLAVLQMIRQQQPRGTVIILARDFKDDAFWKRYRVLVRRAGLPADRRNGPQKMRRSYASYLKAAGGDPTAALGHSSDSVTNKHYLDPSIANRPQPTLFRLG